MHSSSALNEANLLYSRTAYRSKDQPNETECAQRQSQKTARELQQDNSDDDLLRSFLPYVLSLFSKQWAATPLVFCLNKILKMFVIPISLY